MQVPNDTVPATRESQKILGFLYGYHLPFALRTLMRRHRSVPLWKIK